MISDFWQCPWDLDSEPAERVGQGEVGGCTRGYRQHGRVWAWPRKAFGWSRVGHFSPPLHKWTEKTVLPPCTVGPPFLAVKLFSSVLMGNGLPRAGTIDCPLMGGCG